VYKVKYKSFLLNDFKKDRTATSGINYTKYLKNNNEYKKPDN